jgi:hypothetical protein
VQPTWCKAQGMCSRLAPAAGPQPWTALSVARAANADAAQALWEDAGAALPDDYAAALIPYLGHQHEDVRAAAADGLAAAVEV